MTEAERRKKIEQLKEHLRPKCRWWYKDGAGGYCKLKEDPSSYHIHFRTLCFGKKGTDCILPDKYEEVNDGKAHFTIPR